MPRPKRSKVAASAPALRVKKATKPAAQPVEVKALPVKAPFDDLYDLSDSDERGKRESLQNLNKDTDKGGAELGVMGTSSVHTSAMKKGKADADIEREIEQARSELMNDIDILSSSPDIEVGRREMIVSTPSVEGSRLVIGNFRRRARQPSILGQAAGRGRSSSVESNLAYENGLTSVGRKNTLALGMADNGVRPRQPSTSTQNVTHTAFGSGTQGIGRGTPAFGSALKIGNFKRRAREPSILQTAQKQRQPRLEYDNEDDEDDFNPEDQSTPLNLGNTRLVASSSAMSSSNHRKRKLSAIQVQLSSPTLPSMGDSEEQETVPATDPHSDEADDSTNDSSPKEVALPSMEPRHLTPEVMSETMAPPHSTSNSSIYSSIEVELPPLPAPSRGRQILRASTPALRRSNSFISSPPSLTHSPNFPAAATSKAKRNRRPTVPPSAFSTAQLQSLLPRRRRRVHDDPFNISSSDDEVDTSGLASDDDELSHLNIRAPQRRQTGILSRTPAILKKTIRPKTATKPNQIKAKVVYGSRNRALTSDKENEEVDPDDSLAPLPDEDGLEDSQELEKRVGAELKRAARKFQEVDKWELEFETVTASSLSPGDAR